MPSAPSSPGIPALNYTISTTLFTNSSHKARMELKKWFNIKFLSVFALLANDELHCYL